MQAPGLVVAGCCKQGARPQMAACSWPRTLMPIKQCVLDTELKKQAATAPPGDSLLWCWLPFPSAPGQPAGSDVTGKQ